MRIDVGIYGLETPFSTIVEDAFDSSADVTYLRGAEEIETFVSDRTFPNIKILVVTSRSLSGFKNLWPLFRVSLAVPTFHLVILKTEELPSTLQLEISNERIHIVDATGETAGDDLLHHLKTIRTTSEVFGLKYNVLDIFVHEEIFAEEYDFKTEFIRFIQELGLSIQASSVQIFLLQSHATGFFPLYQWGEPIHETFPFEPVEKFCTFKKKCQTYRVSFSQLEKLSGKVTPEHAFDFAVLSSFTLDAVPLFIVYTFGGPQSEDLLWETCNISSWEILHLLYTHLYLARYRTLTLLNEIQQFNLERRDVLNHILDCLQKHFGADGASIVEYKGVIDANHKFEKFHKHYGNYDHRVFSTDHGFAYRSVVENKAFFIKETLYDKEALESAKSRQKPKAGKSIFDEAENSPKPIGHGHGVQFDPQALELKGGEPIEIPLYRSEGTVEDEVSVMYYPLFKAGEIIGAIKIADFKRPNAYGVLQLRGLSVFSDPIVIILESAQNLSRLKISKDQVPAALEQLATLLSYRNLIRDIFHQVSQYLSDIGTDLLTLGQLVKSSTQSSEADKTELIANIRSYANFGLDLINKAKKRGEDLQPIAKDCMLLEDVVRPVLKYAKKKTDTYKISLTTTLTSRDYPVRLDPDFAQESLKNILNNAIWAVREHKGGGRKSISIAVRESSDNSVYIEVADSGIGIDPQIRSSVGSLFFSTRLGGSGVGVYSARRHAEHFGGSLRIEHSMPGKGTTIKIFFPLREENR